MSGRLRRSAKSTGPNGRNSGPVEPGAARPGAVPPDWGRSRRDTAGEPQSGQPRPVRGRANRPIAAGFPLGRASLWVGAGLAALVAGAALTIVRPSLFPWRAIGDGDREAPEVALPWGDGESALEELGAWTPEQRAAELQALADRPRPSRDRARARYLLAVDALGSGDGDRALALLEGLEANYPVLAPYVRMRQAQAQALSGDAAGAMATWESLLADFPEDPAAAEALYVLGKADPSYWDRAIAPDSPVLGHPRTTRILRERLQAGAGDGERALLSAIVRSAPDDPDIGTFAVRLEQRYGAQLTPEEWTAIADVYWRKFDYARAGAAYAQAEPTPRNAYRAGRGLQLGGQRARAIAAYQRSAAQFPGEPETGDSLLRLAALSPAQDALVYLDRAMADYPEAEPEALRQKAKRLDELGSAESASTVRQMLLEQHGDSDAAAELRWELAQAAAEQGDVRTAWTWAWQIPTESPTSDLAPKAAFWVGKWAERLNNPEDARQAYEQVLVYYPESYYAWRSAAKLGLPVGSFSDLRNLQPDIQPPTARSRSVSSGESPLPAGSEALQELYFLREDWTAWERWQAEFAPRRSDPSVAEQFVDGVLRVGAGDYLDGIFWLSNLAWRDGAEDRAAYQQLRESETYWASLYPFPYQATVQKWSVERNLNPMMVMALMRQESRFEKDIRSVAGAVGLMQVMPGTGQWVADQIGMAEFDLEDPDDNVALGTWFLDYTHREYDNNSLLALASYNAGPGNVAKWLREQDTRDPDEFAAAIPFPETRGYVESVFENYWNYMRLYNPEVAAAMGRYARRQ